MSYNGSYVFGHCPLGVNSVRHSRVRVVILLETQVEGESQREVRVRSGGKAGGRREWRARHNMTTARKK